MCNPHHIISVKPYLGPLLNRNGKNGTFKSHDVHLGGPFFHEPKLMYVLN